MGCGGGGPRRFSNLCFPQEFNKTEIEEVTSSSDLKTDVDCVPMGKRKISNSN